MKWKKIKTLLTLSLALGTFSVSTFAEDRALLIGVGEYKNHKPGSERWQLNLPGIDLDINMMKDTARMMGFEPDQIKVIMDEEATTENVKQVMQSWLTEGVNPDDRVLIYYSGHGTNIPDENGDEADGVDEVLTMYELGVTRRGGKSTLTGVLRDDDIGQILKRIPSKNTLFLIDACHSGTATKGLSLSSRSFDQPVGVSKFFYYDNMPSSKSSFSVAYKSGTNYVSLAAAQDNQKAIATEKGSVFTLGVQNAVAQAAAASGEITLKEIEASVSDYIVGSVKANQVFNPHLSGNKQLAGQTIKLKNRKPVWQALEQIAAGAGQLKVSNNGSTTYLEGDVLELTTHLPRDGYLNIVSVSRDDKATILFPNRFHNDNHVSRGQLVFPTDKMGFDITAGRPFGQSMVVAMLTKKKINLYESGFKGLGLEEGNEGPVFRLLSYFGMSEATKNFAVGKKKNVHAGKLYLKVCESKSRCQ